MKDQYVGDVNDFFKYSILEIMEKSLYNKVLIVWMLTKSEGMDTDYKEFEIYNPLLYDKLQKIIASNQRNLKAVELIYKSYIYQSSPFEKHTRLKYFKETKKMAEKCDLIFFDPDIGISYINSKKDTKHLYWDEIKEFWNLGKDLLIYQHFPHKKWYNYFAEMNEYIKKDMEGSFLIPIQTRNVMFICLAHKNIKKDLEHEFIKWNNKIKIFDIQGTDGV